MWPLGNNNSTEEKKDQPAVNTSPSKAKLLIVEDDEFFIQAYVTKFAQEGIDVEVATDGGMALEKVKALNPALIILDLMIPVKDGFLVLEELQGNPATKSIPIIISSNLDQDASVKKGIALGAKDYFVKSNVSLDEVVKKVKEYLPK
jgi:DNA-binding response OmpR family regulator